MGFFDFLDPTEREYRQRASEKAKEYRSEARDYMSDAEDHYDYFKEYRSEAKEESYELSKELRAYLEYKASILNELGTEVGQTMQSFKDFKIEVRVPANIKIDANVTSDTLRKVTAGMSSSSNIVRMPDTPSIFKLADLFSDPYEEKERAREERLEARLYCSRMERAKIRMREILDSLRMLRKDVRDNRSCMEEMMGKIRKIMGLLKESMQKDSFTEAEAGYLNGIYKIAGMIKDSLEQSVMGNDGKRTDAYAQFCERMKELNNSLPSAPSLTDRSWLSILASYDV